MVPGYSLCSFPSLDSCLTPETQCLVYAFYRVVYNVFFHPLRQYPGPWHRGASRLPYTISIFRGDVTFRVKALHDKYGKVVRITPDTLSYTDSQAWSGMWMVCRSVSQSLLILAFFLSISVFSCADVYSLKKTGSSGNLPKDPKFYVAAPDTVDTIASTNPQPNDH